MDQEFARKTVANYEANVTPTALNLTLGDGNTNISAVDLIQVNIGFRTEAENSVTMWQDSLIMEKLLDRVVLGHRLFQDQSSRGLYICYQQNALLIDSTTILWAEHPSCKCHGPPALSPIRSFWRRASFKPGRTRKPLSWVQITNSDPDAADCRLPELSVAQLNQYRQILLWVTNFTTETVEVDKCRTIASATAFEAYHFKNVFAGAELPSSDEPNMEHGRYQSETDADSRCDRKTTNRSPPQASLVAGNLHPLDERIAISKKMTPAFGRLPSGTSEFLLRQLC
jgi:hypothetical protein